jgi:opacity protein-like surface antigen
MQIKGDVAMIRAKMLVTGILGAVLVLASTARAQEDGFMRHEVAVQGTGFFTKDSQQNGISQHSTNTGGFLVNYRFHINGNFGIQANVHQATGAVVADLPVTFARMRPYVLAGAGALVFDPTGNNSGLVTGVERQARAAFVYGGGVDYRLVRHVALRLEYRGFVYDRPDFGIATLSSSVLAHTAEPSAGLVFHF